MPGGDGLKTVTAYHERTKHHYDRQAASLGYLDWANQPNPFRRYDGTPLISLPMPPLGRDLPFWKLYAPGEIASEPLTLESLSLFFRYSLSLTAWKSIADSSWALRANPSSGNLHPTEGYAILPPVADISGDAGVYHYAPKEHALEQRKIIDPSIWKAGMSPLPSGSFLVGLSSVYWREAWKYGERAFRYCQHDVGHAIGSLRFAAAALGWKLTLIEEIDDQTLARAMGLDRVGDYGEAERENPEMLALVTPGAEKPTGYAAISPTGPSLREALQAFSAGLWKGTANRLSTTHAADWSVIDEVALASQNMGNKIQEDLSGFPTEGELYSQPIRSGGFSAEKVILGRRSAVSMDGKTGLSREAFYRMMARVCPSREGLPPWDALPWRPRVHLGVFVHRVEGLEPGLYALVRDRAKTETLRKAFRKEIEWTIPPDCPPGLSLYLLQEADMRGWAAGVSCGQNIAGDGAFSLGMIAEFKESLKTYGPFFYRNLFWEAGLIGQVLYLEAEEAGIRATGIGCYFDDPVHDLFGLMSGEFQSLYHFTVGGPVEDKRLTTLPAYQS